MARVKKFFESAKFRVPLLGFIGLTALTFGLRKNNQESPNQPLSQQKDSIPIIKHPTQSVSFVNDTLDSYISALLTYSNNKIVRYLVKNSHTHRMQLPLFVHEWWHHHNKKIPYWYKIKYSPSQFIQLKMHEEISANIAAIATADLEYQLADDKNAVIKKYENTYMRFYFDAIKDGTIKPESTDSTERDKKFTLLMNGTIQMWEQKYRAHYTPSLTLSLKQYLKKHGFHKPVNKNYRRILSHMYTFGDVDLSKYIKKDAHFPDIKINIFDDVATVKSFDNTPEFRDLLINHIYAYAGKLPYYGVHQRQAILQHIFIATKLKYELRKLNNYALEANDKAIACAYDKVCYELSQDVTFLNFMDKCTYLHQAKIPFDDEKICLNAFDISSILDESCRDDIAQIYSFRHTDLTKFIKNFDLNRLPTDKSRWAELSTAYLSQKQINKLIVPVPQGVYCSSNNTQKLSPLEAIISENISSSNQISKLGKHLSEKLFVTIPNFEEALFNPRALTPKVRSELKQLFKAFNDIPQEFIECDVKSAQKHIKKYGNPHYFEYNNAPYQAHYVTSNSNHPKMSLVEWRRLKQRRSKEK